jgi:hypothetical protein
MPQQAPSIHAANFSTDVGSLSQFIQTSLEYSNKFFEKTKHILVHNTTSISLALTQCGSHKLPVKQ